MTDEADPSKKDVPRGKWPYIWGVWVVLVLGSFFAIEIPALVNETGGDTLTEQVQYLGGFWPMGLVIFIVSFAGWLISHFVGRDSRIWKYAAARRTKEKKP